VFFGQSHSQRLVSIQAHHYTQFVRTATLNLRLETSQTGTDQATASAKGFRFAIVASRWNDSLVSRLIEGAQDALAELSADPKAIEVFRVPGSFEIPLCALKAAESGKFDAVIVGADRIAANGDAANKIGTYTVAVLANAHGVPFYVGLPSTTIDFMVTDGVREIPIEQRGAEEVATMTGRTADGRIETVQVVPDGSKVANYAFDVTPARLVTGLITERGVIAASREALAKAFPERASAARKAV